MISWKKSAVAIALILVGLASLSALGTGDTFTLTVLSTNDTHGQPLAYPFSGAVDLGGTNWNSPAAGGLAARKTYFDQVKATQPDTLIVDAGDVNTGNVVSNLFEAKPDILGMNLAGYQAMALGNHEFDVSQKSLLARRADAAFPFLSANTYVKATGKRLVDPYTILRLKDLSVAIIGVTTTDTPTAVMPANVADLEFRDPAAEIRALLPEVRAKADFVVVLSHIGLPEDRKLAAQVPGIDLIIGGHSHTYMTAAEVVNGTPIFQAFTGGVFVGRVDVSFVDGKVASVTAAPQPINLAVELKEGQTAVGTVKEIKGKKYDFPGGYFEADPSVAALLQPFADQVAKDMDTVIATAAGEFPHAINGLTNYPRRDDTALTNLLVDAMREATSLKVGQNVDVFLQNGGGIRAPIPAGPVTKRTITTVLPFDNTIMTAKLTGAQLLDLLTNKALPVAVANWNEKYSGPDGSFLQVSGMRYTLDLAAKTVSDVTIGGQPVDPAKTYTIATQNFMMTGGDGYTALKAATDVYSTSVFQRDMVIDWLTKKGTIDPADYNDNRINVLNTGK
jgi:2',3'-cyclic-nucleotide 2'-phosphodiesterase (5'-nucleotidase family)